MQGWFFFQSSLEDMLIDSRERRREGERDRNFDQLPLVRTPTGDQTHNPGVCSNQESNQRPGS